MWIINENHESLGDYVTQISNIPAKWDQDNRESDSNSGGQGEHFSGCKSLAEALKLATYGWEEGRKKLAKGMDVMKGQTSLSDMRVFQHDVAGFLPDVPAAISGIPDCMYNFGDVESQKRPIIRILVNLTTNGNTSKESMINRGAAILSYVDALEQAGFSCEINGYMMSESRDNIVKIGITLKQAGEALDVDRMAFALVHPAILRRLFFRSCEQHKVLEGSHRRSYGSARDVSAREARESGYSLNYQSFDNGGFRSPEEALKTIKTITTKQLNERGITL